MVEIMTEASAQLDVEHLTLTGGHVADEGALSSGLRRGEVFVVRNLLQRAGVLAPIRAILLEVLEEVAGSSARAEVERRGLRHLHDIVPIEAIMAMHPPTTARVRALSPRIVAGMAESLRLGPDVHFEDAPNVRIFTPFDFGVQHREALNTFAQTQGRGRLTLHGPHQDDRHFHPLGAVNIWCALDSVKAENGMAVFPQFYGELLPFNEGDGSVRADQYLGPPVAADLGPGDALCFETIQVHGSTINQTDETRVVVSCRLTLGSPVNREKQWYSYVRPIDCSDDGPPRVAFDYSVLPGRGPVTLDTSDQVPSLVPSTRRADGRLEIAADLIVEGEIRPLSETLCVTRLRGEAVAFERACPHEGADLAGATILDGRVVCPWHGLRLNLSDGTSGCRSMRPASLPPCVEVDGLILVGLAAEPSTPLGGLIEMALGTGVEP